MAYESWAHDSKILQNAHGIHLPAVEEYLVRANDAAITPANIAYPSQLTTYLDPKIIEILVAPMKAKQLYGEGKKGDWLTRRLQFPMLEAAGNVAAYGDFSNAGMAKINTNFPEREQMVVQTIVRWGDYEAGQANLASIDLENRKRLAAVLSLNYWTNDTYFYGVKNLSNYGSLNDPNLLPSMTPLPKAAGGITWDKATALEVYNDIKALFGKLMEQTKGLVNLDNAVQVDSPLVLGLSPKSQSKLTELTDYQNKSVLALLKENYTNLEVISAPQFATDSGNLLQMFIKNYQEQDTITCAFSEKLRSHGYKREISYGEEKLSQGSWGTIIYRPALIAQMLGV